ncbi:predicted protein [Chaetomium globosum CBS 148.51]|uniref:Uncharacterized protein n=1 Tax=Chaetomium globosum (strain ATCC 6205 / CBS 148.51 / DSM 1962 / NBRC 6347 / NRRL 1970) TaxID=306901 RepID=Q2H2S9_CHAGB|nr:uncharacterized protein CHGG_03917 [Chaetomium globosum CBS 148.51]EAQ87298.1 predicted protein [Chaetomium globosum CBS 148.51]
MAPSAMGLCPMRCARQTTGEVRARPCRVCSQRIGSCVQKFISLIPAEQQLDGQSNAG